jgi:hypothetical protein
MGSTRGISLASPQNGTTANTLNLLPSTPKTAQILAAGELGEVRKLANAEDLFVCDAEDLFVCDAEDLFVCVLCVLASSARCENLQTRRTPVCVRRGGPVCVRLVRLGELGEVRKPANSQVRCEKIFSL